MFANGVLRGCVMNLRKVESYSVGLDIGPGSVGWSVVDEGGNLCRFKGKPTWGSRIFPSADPAAETRTHRGQRRRYDRRRQRLDLLQGIFADEVAKVDPDFFIRLNQSRLKKDDRDPDHADYCWPLFNGDGLSEPEYYEKFPTIYHLRKWLIETDECADIRLIYLAFHNIVKHRGNFLYQETPGLSAKNANTHESVNLLCCALEEWCALEDIACSPRPADVIAAFEDESLRTGEKQERIAAALGFEKSEKKKAAAISKAVVGYSADFSALFGEGLENAKFALSNEEKIEEFSCPDSGVDLFDAMRAVYSSFVLMGILNGAQGELLSTCKVREYDRYGEDLALLKSLVREYATGSYESFFRGVFYEGTTEYDASKAEGYTAYNLGTSKLGYDEFLKAIDALFEGTAAKDDARYSAMKESMEDRVFLRRLKTSDNGSIPYQLHLEEMDAIIDRQSKHYPFLAAEKGKIESLVTFRIPYYVGPLTKKNAAKASDGTLRFAWSERLPGKEDEKVFPWNWEEVIDKDASAEAFIHRMTGTCTYLQGEPVLPRCSLMYEMFCVLNELNGAKWTQDGDKWYRFDAEDRLGIIEELFKKRKSGVRYDVVESWLERKHGPNGQKSAGGSYHVRGGQGVDCFESKLSSYCDFCKILEVDELSDVDAAMVEDLILWNTVFEDRAILKRKIKATYGERLSADQVTKICRKRYTGWGRLSRKFLAEMKSPTDNGKKSIMDILLEGDQNSGRRLGRAMNLMEILHDDVFEFSALVESENAQRATGVDFVLDGMMGSPALRRGVNQALRIVDEIIGIAKKPPANIFIEVTRDEDPRNKGKRTKKRYDALKSALSELKKEYADVYGELSGRAPQDLDDERLMLYFSQCGKCMYSGKALDINRLQEYQVDHIIPQSYVKDDSLENKVLVLAGENQRKLDSLLIDQGVVQRMRSFWEKLHAADLIGDKKLNNLMRDRISDDRLKGFINRQLVETGQLVKQVQRVMRARYADTAVLPVKAGLSSQLRSECGFVKCREINDFHHAHDAYLACRMGLFIQMRHGDVFENPSKMAALVKQFVRGQANTFAKTRQMPGSASFIVSSFLTSGFDAKTGEVFKDTWNAEAAVDSIRTSLNYKDCFISRMPEETSGAFWKANACSPKEKSKNLIPLKKGLDPAKYGSYTEEKFAYFFVYEAEKKERSIVEFASVPVWVASALRGNEKALEDYAKELSRDKGLLFKRILKKKIYKYQQIELNGDRLYITGIKEVRNARQLAFTQEETKLAKCVLNGDCSSIEECDFDGFYRAVASKFDLYAKRLGTQLRAFDDEVGFTALSVEEKANILLSLVSIASAKVNKIDLSSLTGSKAAGCMRVTHSKELSDPNVDFWFIDSSVTGMFERRYKLGL